MIEAPSSVMFSAVALTVLVRIAAFPPRDGVLFEKRIAVSLAAGVALAIQLVQWCPWPPVHQNRGFLTLALWLLVPVGVTLENRHKERVDRGAPTPERF